MYSEQDAVATVEGAAMVDDVLAGSLCAVALPETAVPASRRPLLSSCPPPCKPVRVHALIGSNAVDAVDIALRCREVGTPALRFIRAGRRLALHQVGHSVELD